jgi:hypothetical protein
MIFSVPLANTCTVDPFKRDRYLFVMAIVFAKTRPFFVSNFFFPSNPIVYSKVLDPYSFDTDPDPAF